MASRHRRWRGSALELARGSRAGLMLLFLVFTAACRNAPENANAPDATANDRANANDRADANATAFANGDADGGLALCRVMMSEGGPSASADATSWLDIPSGASFTVRTLETGRELRFEGPGRVRPCAGDVALVAEGTAVGLPGGGEVPGAEQWVATACGVARWASGVHRFTGARGACRWQSSLGTANLYIAADVVAEELTIDGGASEPAAPSPEASLPRPRADAGREASPWRRVDARRAFRFSARGPLDTPAATKVALGACESSAANVVALAARMTASDSGANVGDLAAESVTARGTARAACAVAAVRIALAGTRPAEVARLEAASAQWRGAR